MEVPTARSESAIKTIFRSTEDLLTLLPLDLKCEIFSNVDPETVLSARRISKIWLDILINDAIWRRIAEKIFGVCKKDDSVSSWMAFYRFLKQSWTRWDFTAHHPGINIVSNGRSAECDVLCKHDTHLPIRGRQGVRAGKHYFEVSFYSRTENRPSFSSMLCSVGVADKTFVTDRKYGAGYTKENYGIGYYSSGFQFQYGKELDYGPRTTFKIGNTIGFLLDMDNLEIQFYKDRKPVGNTIKLVSGSEEMFPLILSERGLTVAVTQSATEPGELEDMELQ